MTGSPSPRFPFVLSSDCHANLLCHSNDKKIMRAMVKCFCKQKRVTVKRLWAISASCSFANRDNVGDAEVWKMLFSFNFSFGVNVYIRRKQRLPLTAASSVFPAWRHPESRWASKQTHCDFLRVLRVAARLTHCVSTQAVLSRSPCAKSCHCLWIQQRFSCLVEMLHPPTWMTFNQRFNQQPLSKLIFTHGTPNRIWP